MSEKRSLITWRNILVLTAIFLPYNFGAALAESPPEKLIMIYGSWDKSEVPAQVDPNKLWIGRGKIVTWINESESEVKIKFGKGPKCEEIASKAMGITLNMTLDPNRCFVTRDSIRPAGGTMSIRFEELNRYDYEVEYVGKNRKEQGTVIVRSEPRGIYY